MGEEFTTVLIDPNTLCREGLAWILSLTRFQPQERLASLEQLQEVQLPDQKPVLFLVDFGPQADVAAEGVRLLKAQYPNCFLLVLTDQYEARHMWTVLRAGADGYLMKSMSSEALIKSLDLVALGEPVFPAAILDTFSKDVAGPPKPLHDLMQVSRPLSERETEILRRLVQGDSNKVIARQLDITEATVKVHIKAILRKIQVKNRTQAAIWALDHGVSPPTSAQMMLAAGAPARLPPFRENHPEAGYLAPAR